MFSLGSYTAADYAFALALLGALIAGLVVTLLT